MTQAELTGLLTERFYSDFADTVAARIGTEEELAMLYGLVASPPEKLAPRVRHKVYFRGAYVLEKIYLASPERFQPFAERFCHTDFAACGDPSARRHFGKIMALLLPGYDPGLAALERIAEAAGEWAVDPAAKVAVRIWAVEVLKLCRARVGWVAESWDDVLEAMAVEATPGIECRLRKNWRSASTCRKGRKQPDR